MGMQAPITRWCRPPTRRTMLALGLAAAAAPVEADERSQAAQPRISQAEAQYQPTPKGMFSCATCTFFIKPQTCKVVSGDISPMGWCKLFDLPD
jgi:hypothetical protein